MTFSQKKIIMQSIMKSKSILIIRLSSFGDIIQTLPSIDALVAEGYEVDFVTKKSFLAPVKAHPKIRTLHLFETKDSSLLQELKKIKTLIRTQKYDFIYDAHNNLRSTFILWFTFFLRLRLKIFQGKACTFRRGKSRFKRFLLFKFRIDRFKLPFISAQSFLQPLQDHGVIQSRTLPADFTINSAYNENILKASKFSHPRPYICLAPSAAWPLKRWPISHFQSLIESLPDWDFIVIGGPEDTFTFELKAPNLTNTVGQLSWADTGKALKLANVVVSADTGVLHWADYMGVPAIGILGPTAFGVPFRSSSHILNLQLPCSPCTKDGRGKCKIPDTQKCLKQIYPSTVKQEILNLL